MTHSTRSSYKEKYERLKNSLQSDEVDQDVKNLADTAEFISLANYERQRQHEIIQDTAKLVTEMVGIMDSRVGKMDLPFKDIAKPIDSSLPSMDGSLILRRTRDVLRHLLTRVSVAGHLAAEQKEQIQALRTGTTLLKSPVAALQRGYLESYSIGVSPTDKEIVEAQERKGKSPRQLDYDYLTDESDSEDEPHSELSNGKSTMVVASKSAPRKKVASKTSNDFEYN